MLVAADTTGTWYTSEADELSLDHMAVVVDTEDVLGRVLAVITLTHLGLHLLAKGRDALVPDACHARVTLAQRAVAFVTEKSWELGLLVILVFL